MVLWKTTKVDSVDICHSNENALKGSCITCTEPVLISLRIISEKYSPIKKEVKEIYIQTLNAPTNEKKETHKIEDVSGIVEKQEYVNEISEFTGKDGGYAWIVLGAMFIINMLTIGYLKSFGVIFNAIAEIHTDVSATMAGVMMGLLSGFMGILAPFSGAMANLIGIRLTLLIGTFIYCSALICAFFCTSPIQYAIVLGAVIGLSLSFYAPCQVVIMSYFFEKRLSFANGIRVAGNPLGNAVYPLLFAVLLEHFGIKLTLIMLAGVTAQIIVCAAIVRPWDVHLKIEGIKFIKFMLDKRFGAELKYQKENREVNVLRKKLQKKLLNDVMINCSGQSEKKRNFLDLSYFKNPVYLLFVAMAIGIALSCPMLYYYVTIYAKNVLHLSIYEVSTLISIQSVLDIFMLFSIGVLSNKKWYKMAHGYIFCLILSGFGCLCVPLATGFWSLLCFTFIFSFGSNSYHVFINILLSDQFGKESIASTFGFVKMTHGIFAFIHPTLLGFIIDATGGYATAFITMGIGMFFSAFTILIEPCVIKYTKSDIVIT